MLATCLQRLTSADLSFHLWDLSIQDLSIQDLSIQDLPHLEDQRQEQAIMAVRQAVAAASTQRVYWMGNSVTDTVNYAGVDSLAEAAGYTHVWGRHMIPGAPLAWIEAHPNDGFSEAPFGRYPTAFPDYVWDAISFQPFDRPADSSVQTPPTTDGDRQVIGRFLTPIKTKSPNVQIYLYQRWPVKEASGNTAARWNMRWLEAYSPVGSNQCRAFFEALAGMLRADHPTIKAPLIIPVGEVMYQLNLQMIAGEIPGYTSIWDIYQDDIHLTNTVGSYIAGLTAYAAIYYKDPRNSLVPSQYGTIDPALVTKIQNTVWSVVNTYDYTTGEYFGNDQPVIGAPPPAPTPSGLSNMIRLGNAQYTNGKLITSSSIGSNSGVAIHPTPISIGSSTNFSVKLRIKQDIGTSQTTASEGFCLALFNAPDPAAITVNGFANSMGFDNVMPSLRFGMNYNQGAFQVRPGLPGWSTVADIPNTTYRLIDGQIYMWLDLVNGSTIRVYLNTADSKPTTPMWEGTETAVLSALGASATTWQQWFNNQVYVAVASRTDYKPEGIVEYTVEAFDVTTGSTPPPTAPKPTAAFVATPTGLSVLFNPTGSSAASGRYLLGYEWNFGDGSPLSNALSPTKVYATAGTKSVTLRVMDDLFQYSDPVTQTVTVTAPTKPTAAISRTINGLAVAFNSAGSTAASGKTVTGWSWNFGDGSAVSTAQNPTKTYAAAGTYTVTLTVTDNSGIQSDPVTQTVVVNVSNPQPVGSSPLTLAEKLEQARSLLRRIDRAGRPRFQFYRNSQILATLILPRPSFEINPNTARMVAVEIMPAIIAGAVNLTGATARLMTGDGSVIMDGLTVGTTNADVIVTNLSLNAGDYLAINSLEIEL